jgi:hypothetical protein
MTCSDRRVGKPGRNALNDQEDGGGIELDVLENTVQTDIADAAQFKTFLFRWTSMFVQSNAIAERLHFLSSIPSPNPLATDIRGWLYGA